MYNPSHFIEARLEEIQRVIERYPLGILVINGPNGLDANHLPFEFHPATGAHGSLTAHVARKNPVWKEVKDGEDVLVIFRGADAYISPNWYPSKHESHQQVPTWNYQVVHVHGKIKVRDDKTFVMGVVARLTHKHEASLGDARPWKMGDSSKEFLDEVLAEIVGIEIEVTRIVAKSKLGQNREERDRLAAAEELRKRGEQVISSAMKEAKTPKP
jgi:transcriptional regulator